MGAEVETNAAQWWDGPDYPGRLQVGQQIFKGGQACESAVITGVWQGYVDVAYEDGAVSNQMPEGIIRALPWRISDAVLSPESLGLLLADCAEHERARKAAEAAEAERRNAEADALEVAPEYAYLEKLKDSTKSRWALAAANIRKELRRAFPGVKFRVRSDAFSGGCSVDVDWTDGPTARQVEAVTGKYQDGHFDGMIDLYENDADNVWPSIYGGAKFVQVQRGYSAAAMRWAAARAVKRWGLELPGDPVQEETASDWRGGWRFAEWANGYRCGRDGHGAGPDEWLTTVIYAELQPANLCGGFDAVPDDLETWPPRR